MKKASFILFLFFFSISSVAAEGSFVIKGRIPGIHITAVNLFTLIPLSSGLTYNIDTVLIDSDSFALYGKIKNPHFFYLFIKADSFSRTSDLFFVDEGQHDIKIAFNDSTFHIINVTNSSIYNEYLYVFLPFIFEKQYKKEATPEEIQNIKDLYEHDYSFRDIDNQVLFDYVHAHPKSFIGFWFLYRRFLFAKSDDNDIYYQNYILLDSKIRQSTAGVILMELLQNENTLSIGKEFPEIFFNSYINDVAEINYGVNSLTLIDFWATWCGPCLREIPTLQDTYSKYISRGFNIISISVDFTKDLTRLKKFVDSLQLNWGNYWDENGFLAHKYKIIFFPTYFLLNNKGEIIARNNRLDPILKIIEKKLE